MPDNHGRSPEQDNGLHRYSCLPFTQSSFGQYVPGVGTVRASGGDYGGGTETIVVDEIQTFSVQYASTEYKQSDLSHTLSARDYKCATDLIAQGGDAMNSVVRRLTPLE